MVLFKVQLLMAYNGIKKEQEDAHPWCSKTVKHLKPSECSITAVASLSRTHMELNPTILYKKDIIHSYQIYISDKAGKYFMLWKWSTASIPVTHSCYWLYRIQGKVVKTQCGLPHLPWSSLQGQVWRGILLSVMLFFPAWQTQVLHASCRW